MLPGPVGTHSRSPGLLSLVWPVGLCLVLAGCGRHHQPNLKVLVIGDAAAQSATELVHAATTEGLVALDEQGGISPALADRWIVTDDGQTYIFRLRDGTWPDGSAISGENAALALHRALTGIAHTPLALDLDSIVDIRVMAKRVVEIRLAQPLPDFLQLLAQPELGLSHRGQGAGPMAVKRGANSTVLTPISPEKRGLSAVPGWSDNMHPLVLRTAAGRAAVTAFADGQADVVLGGTFADLPLTSRITLGNGRPRFDPVIGLLGLAVTHTTGLLADAALREAIAMAIDRDTLAAAVGLPTLITTTRMIPPGTSDDTGQIDERWTSFSLADRRAEAGQRIQAWMQHNRQPALLRLAMPAGPGGDLLFARLAQDLAAVAVRVVQVSAHAPADLRLIDIVARYPRAAWFLDQLSCTANHLACSPAADAITARARATRDPVTAAGLTAQAEATLTQENVYIPIGVPIRWSLVAADATRFTVNRWGRHPLIALANGDR